VIKLEAEGIEDKAIQDREEDQEEELIQEEEEEEVEEDSKFQCLKFK